MFFCGHIAVLEKVIMATSGTALLISGFYLYITGYKRLEPFQKRRNEILARYGVEKGEAYEKPI